MKLAVNNSVMPRFNKASLMRMARRQHKNILSSGFKSPLLDLFSGFLMEAQTRLKEPVLTQDAMAGIESDLEIIDAALVHLTISFPVNETLYVPRKLMPQQIGRLSQMLTNKKKRRGHLRIAHSVS
jgi:hypothetical protein